MLRQTFFAAAAVCALAAAPAYAQVSINAVPGSSPYAGPAPTYDFEGALPTGGAPITGGGVITTGTTAGLYAQPFGSTGNYWSIGPSTSSVGVLDLASFAGIASISFIWGSVDTYNFLDVLDRMGNVIATYTGSDVALPADGDQADPGTNPLATLTISGTTQGNIGGLRLRSDTNAFEVDNFAVTAVPEPGVWAMLLLGFGFIGAFMRGHRRQERLRLKIA